MAETYTEMVNRVLRDHEGYTGDGKGGVGALPVGDRSTARKGIDKRDLRAMFLVNESSVQVAIDAAAAASDSADAAALAMVDAQGATLQAASLAALLANTETSYPVGTIFATRAEGYAYEVASNGGHLTTAGGVDLKVLPKGRTFQLGAFNPPSDETTNAAPIITTAIAAASAIKGRLVCSGVFNLTTSIHLESDVELDLREAVFTTPYIPHVEGTVEARGMAIPYRGSQMIMGLGKTNFKIIGGTFDNRMQTMRTAANRAIGLWGCSYYEVRDGTFYVDGAAVASIGCGHYKIHNNTAHCHPDHNGSAAHDGVFDQWGASSHFEVSFNRVYGNDIGRYAFLWTATTAVPEPAPSSNGRFFGNYAEKCTATGIWIQGRTGVISGFQVIGNTAVDIRSAAYRITDARDGVFSGNVGIRPLHQMLSAGAESVAGGVTGAQGVIVSGNAAHHVNQAETSDLANGSAYYIGGNNSSVVFSGNTVAGNKHTRPYTIAAVVQAVAMGDGLYPSGTQGPGLRQSPPGSGRFEAIVTFADQSISDGAQVYQDFTVSGVAVGDHATVAPAGAMDGLHAWAEVTAANTVRITISNMTGDAKSAGPRTFYIAVTARRQV